MTKGELLVAAVRAKGSDARDVRDAAHEATHALRWKVRAPWTRDRIHDKAPAPRDASRKIREEIIARAVEALICAELGVEYDLPTWAMTCAMEQVKMEGIAVPSLDWLIDAIKNHMAGLEAKRTAAAVLALAAEPKRKRTRAAAGVTP